MASKHDLSTIFIVIIRLIDELCFSDDHVCKLVPRVSLLPARWSERGREEETLGTRLHVSTNTSITTRNMIGCGK